MTFDPPLTLFTCEACDGAGGYVEADGRHPNDPWPTREIECPHCGGFGSLVVEVEQDGPATITSIRSTEPVAKQHERWAEFRARISPWARVPEGTS